MRRMIFRGCAVLLIGMLLLVIGTVGFVWSQAQRTSTNRPEYVALGSSFATGAGLGAVQDDSPLLCARTDHGYPQVLARLRNLSIVDMSCGGAVTRQLLNGGQFFQRPPIRVIGPETKLVTITVGGNDVGYIGDLQMLAARHGDTVAGWLIGRIWGGPKPVGERNYAQFERELRSLLLAIRAKAPEARIAVATYPAVLPPAGTCPQIKITGAQADLVRKVGDRLADATRSAAKAGGALLVDMHRLGVGHDACSAMPWVKGATDLLKAPFHPTQAGAKATAAAISDALDYQQL